MQSQDQRLSEDQIFKIEQQKRAKLERKMKNTSQVVNTFRLEDDPKYLAYLEERKQKKLQLAENFQ